MLPKIENRDVTVFASAARTTTTNSEDQENRTARGLVLFLDVTAASGTSPTLNMKIQGKDDVSGSYYDIAGAAMTTLTAVSSTHIMMYPGIAETANVSISDILPRVWRCVATIGGTGPSFTFTLGASLII